jgi:DNA repair protein RadC
MHERLKYHIQNLLESNDCTLAERLLAEFPTADSLINAKKEDFQRIKGIILYRAQRLYTAFQIAKELHRPMEPVFIRSPKDIYDFLGADLRYLQQEHIICVFLNTKNWGINT